MPRRSRGLILSMVVPGALLSLGAAGSIGVQVVQAPVAKLMGELGLPGAIIALAFAFWLGVKAMREMRQPPPASVTSQIDVALSRLEGRLDQLPTREHMAKVAQENRHDARAHVLALTLEVSALNGLLRRHLKEPE